ncbi:hypothetical protein CAI21_22050 [Alkalilimnicola ehrlichii]|uniref:YdbS-like PH domain-containing protein n=1 Tax=Alkalilimnicola ehrlichii TaxID=351052 RepID=A0A3E0WF29_9GAMM|nr:PH domain-containing protein [Alkalilimnicola ehrlichii]RFA24336.1 hypothetical protein CAI21_22050 [Alkalilimnicola ehrlichii]RFA31562.1 hypothetical protein CAL65_22225 [Alkalilimnicola ehrlichii]
MGFTNKPIEQASLPAVETLALAPVSPRFAPYQVLSALAQWLPLVVLLWLFIPFGMLLPWVPGVLAMLAMIGLPLLAALAWIEAKRREFGLREHDVVYRSGILVRRTTILPLVRIQHVETVSGPLERLFDLLRVRCFTAGGASADLVVRGLRQEEAEQVRQYLLGRIREQEPASAGGAND